jgi:hypothetical protein
MKPAIPNFARQFWLGYALPVGLLALGVDGLSVWAQLEGRALRAVAIAVVAGGLLLLALAWWRGIPTFRAAVSYVRRGGAPLWGYGAQVVVGLTSLLIALAAVWVYAPELGDWLNLSLGRDPDGQASLQASPDGRSLRLQGHLGQGDAARLQAVMAATPTAYLLELDSPGARFHEARALAAAVRQRGLQTRVVGTCDAACGLVFLAGQGRQVMPGSSLGLHRLQVQAANPLMLLLAKRWAAAEYRSMGLDDNHVFGAMGATLSKPWPLDGEALALAGLAGVPGRPLDITPPPRAGAQLAEFVAALNSGAVWRVLEQRSPGLVAEAAQRMFEAQAAGADNEAQQVAAQRVVEPLLSRLLQEVGYTLHEPYLALLSDQLVAAKASGAAVCQGLLSGDTVARRTLPPALQLRETAWLLEAAREAPGAAKRRLSPLEMEVVRKSLGNRAPAVLAGVRSVGAGDARADACERPVAFIAEINRLPPGERRLATRLIFERS